KRSPSARVTEERVTPSKSLLRSTWAELGCHANGRNRRILVVAGRPGEGPFTIRFADLRHDVSRTATHALASRLTASWLEARITKGAKVSGDFSKSWGGRRLRPNHEKVRSTTQRRGRTTKPFLSSRRLTISMRSRGPFATAASACAAL